MGKRSKKHIGASARPPADGIEPAFSLLSASLWCAVFALLAFVPDQKILRYKLLAVEAGVAVIGATCLLRWSLSKNPSWRKTPLDIPVALYAAGGVLFYLLSPEKGASSLELTRTLFCAATFFTVSQTYPHKEQIDPIPAAWLGTASLLSIYALLQTAGGLGPLSIPQASRPFATFGNPIFLSAYLSSSACFAAVLAYDANGIRRKLLWTAFIVLIAGVLTTASRGALAGLAGAALLFSWEKLNNRKRIMALLSALIFLICALYYFRDRQWTHGLIWRDTLALWSSNPWFGCGLGRFHIEFPAYASDALKALWPQRSVIVNFAHNEYLQVLAETGIVGLALLALVIVTAARWWNRSRTDSFALAAAAILIQNFFSPDIRFGLSSFLLFFALAAAVSSEASERNFPAFPGRHAIALIGALFLLAWSRKAAEPFLAQKRLSRQPSFHSRPTSEQERMIAVFEARLAADPANADLAENIAFLYAKQKSWPKAIARFQLASRLAPRRPGPLNNLGNIFYMIGDKENAISYWKKSLAVKSDQTDAHLNLGKTLYELGRLKESAAHLQTVLRMRPNDEKAQILLKKMIE